MPIRPMSATLAIATLVCLSVGSGPGPARAADPPAASPSTAAPATAEPQLAAAKPVAPAAGGAKADLVLKNAAVYTVDRVRSWAEAVAIRGEKIVYVGGNGGAARHIGPNTKVVDLGGKMVLPGFQDAHAHPVYAGIERMHCSLFDLPTKEDYIRTVAEYAAKHPNEKWIRGSGWDMTFYPKGIPHRRDLDAVVPDRPVFLYSQDGHQAWVNSKALEMAGITRDTPDPERGRIDRDRHGEPVGSLQESAVDLVSKLLPPYTHDEARGGLRSAIQKMNAMGVTSLQDGFAHLDDSEGFRLPDIYRDLDRAGELTVRTVLALIWYPEKGEAQIPELIRARREYTRGRVRASAVKVLLDGLIESRTALMLEPYRGEEGDHGMALMEPEALKRYVTRLDKEKFQVHFHTMGNAAVRQAFDALEAARRVNGDRDSRHHLSHVALCHPDDIRRFRELGAVATFQPLWARANSYITDLTLPVLQPETHRWIYPIGRVLRSGGVVAFGSCNTSPNPLEIIEVAMRRADWKIADAEPFIPEERIDLRDAIAASTINAAYVNFHDDRTGSLEVGKLADLAVLDRNLFAIPVSEISETKVLLTLLGGRAVYGDVTEIGGLPGHGGRY